MATITTRVNGVKVTATSRDGMWDAVIYADEPMERKPYDLRSTYSSTGASTALYCAMWDTACYYGIAGYNAQGEPYISI